MGMLTATALVPVPSYSAEQLLLDPALCLSELVRQQQQCAYCQEMYRQSMQREAQQAETIRQLQAEIEQLKHQLFGRKSEKQAPTTPSAPASDHATAHGGKRRRGQQPGQPGPKRRRHDHLPVVEELHQLPDSRRRCPHCSLPYEPFPGTEDSEVIEIEVHGYRRRIRRQRYHPTCACPGIPGIITTPAPPKLIPKGRYGISVWVEVLLQKFLFFSPSHRLIANLASHGIALPAGTLAGGLQTIAPWLEPLYQAMRRHCQADSRWHADETGWRVFVRLPDNATHKRTLWVFCSPEAVLFTIALTRSADEPEAFFGANAAGILNVDRFSSYKALSAVKQGTLLLAFCWAHVRRDFLALARGHEEPPAWVAAWIERIAQLFHLNGQRVEAWEKDPCSLTFHERDAQLRTALEQFTQLRDEQLQQADLAPAQRKVLTSLVNHWSGLTVFLDHPEVPMDNSEAERTLRGPVMGRKNYWGSGANWAAELAERCFSLFATLWLAGLNVRTWLTAFFTACAEAGSRVPDGFERLLPWNLTASEREAFCQAVSGIELPGAVRHILDTLRAPSVPGSVPVHPRPPPEDAAAPDPATPGPATPDTALPDPATPVTAMTQPAAPIIPLSDPATPVTATPLPATRVPATPEPVPVPATPVPATPLAATPDPAVSATSVTASPVPSAATVARRTAPVPASPWSPQALLSASRVATVVASPDPTTPQAQTTGSSPNGVADWNSAAATEPLPRKYSGRPFTSAELQQVRQLIAQRPHASRAAIARELCERLDWRKRDGGLKQLSCRAALLRMQRDGLVSLPALRASPGHGRRGLRTAAGVPQQIWEGTLEQLGDLRVEIVRGAESSLWNEYIDRYHYLGYRPLVGAQLRYVAWAGEQRVGLFGYAASAWRLAARDRWIGWDDAEREAGLGGIVGQVRFLILPWVRCRNLASRLLSLSAARLARDWEQRYGIRPWLLETFVDGTRFSGACYRAANWIELGETAGRGQHDDTGRPRVAKKLIFIYPLCRQLRQALPP